MGHEAGLHCFSFNVMLRLSSKYLSDREQTLLEQKMTEKEEYLQKLTKQINSLSLTVSSSVANHKKVMEVFSIGTRVNDRPS